MFYQYDQLGGDPEYIASDISVNMSYPEHMHQDFEFLLILEGQMKVTVDFRCETLNAGDAVLIFPNQVHSFESTCSRCIMLLFSPLIVGSYTKIVKNRIPVSGIFRPNEYLADSLCTLSDKSPITFKKAVLYMLCDQFGRQAEYVGKSLVKEKPLTDMLIYVENSFGSECSLQNIADQIGYDYKYLSHLFKRSVGINFNEYVNNYRLAYARNLMATTENSILQCALDSGFGSVRTFNRLFKARFGMTPVQFRTQGKAE